MNKDKLQKFAYLTVAVIGIALAAFIVLRYLFVPILPFLIAWATALALRPATRFVHEKTRINKKLVGALLAIVTVTAGLGAVIGIAVLLLSEAWRLISEFMNDEGLYDVLSALTNPISSIFGDGENIKELEAYLGDSLSAALSKLLDGIVELLTSIVKGVPGVLFFILITVIASIYFSMDIDNINTRVRSFLPEGAVRTLTKIKSGFFTVGAKYIRSYIFLMMITFGVMLVGFLLIGVEGALAVAAVTALLDILPLIGVGTVLIPWSIFSLIMGNTGRAIALLVLFAVHELIRQLAEPRIVGKNLGLHPIISLLLLYIGYSLFGFAGLLLTPVVSVIINVLVNKDNSAKVGEGSRAE